MTDLFTPAYQRALEIMKSHATNFYRAFSKLPEAKFKAVTAVYAFCRTVDDIVDESYDKGEIPQMDAKAKLLSFAKAIRDLEKDVIDAVFCNDTREVIVARKIPFKTPDVRLWWPAFVESYVLYDVPLESCLDQIRGQLEDLSFKGIKDFEDLERYSLLVAGSVGGMLLPILLMEQTVPLTIQNAGEQLGVAMQITNILRDVGEDIKERDRIYLPTSLLEKYNVSTDELKALTQIKNERELKARIPQGFKDLWEELAAASEQRYRLIEPYLGSFEPSARVPLLAASLYYEGILNAVRRADYNCFTRRNYTSKLQAEKLLLKAKRLARSYS